MLLRAGGESEGAHYDVRAARDATRESGVPHGGVLLAFADAVLGAGDAALDEARAALARAMGERAVGDAAAIVATFECVDRIADATGLPLDAIVDFASQDVQAELGLRGFASASNTPARALERFAGRVLVPVRTKLMRLGSRFLR